jgi:hypothetical protein
LYTKQILTQTGRPVSKQGKIPTSQAIGVNKHISVQKHPEIVAQYRESHFLPFYHFTAIFLERPAFQQYKVVCLYISTSVCSHEFFTS